MPDSCKVFIVRSLVPRDLEKDLLKVHPTATYKATMEYILEQASLKGMLTLMKKGNMTNLSLWKSTHCLPRSVLWMMLEVLETKLVEQSHMVMILVKEDLIDRKRKLGQIIRRILWTKLKGS